MKTKDVLSKLRITRPTLTKYVRTGVIRVRVLPNGRYDYNEEDVFAIITGGIERATYVYASTWKNEMKQDTANQIESMKKFCIAKGYSIGGIYTDTNCTTKIETRPESLKILDDVIDGKVERIIMTDKFRLSHHEFELLQYIIEKHPCKIEMLVQ